MGYLRKAISLSLTRTKTNKCLRGGSWLSTGEQIYCINKKTTCGCKRSRFFIRRNLARWLTRTPPHLRQVAVRLPGLLAQLHHISAERVRGNRDLSEMLVVVTEVNRQKHLQDSGEGRTRGGRGSIRDTSRRASERERKRERDWEIPVAFEKAESTLWVAENGGLFPHGWGCGLL